MRWPTFVLLHSAQMELDRTVKPDALSKMEGEWWTANTLYNLACYHARAAACEASDDHMQRACRYLRDGIDRATEPRLMLAMAKTDPTLVEVVKNIPDDEQADLTGEKLPEPPHKADADRGRGIGIEVREGREGSRRPRRRAQRLDWALRCRRSPSVAARRPVARAARGVENTLSVRLLCAPPRGGLT